MVEGGLYRVVLTPEFEEDLLRAAMYVSNELASPIAARNLVQGIQDALDRKRAMPTAAPTYVSLAGEMRYVATYKRWGAYYVVEGDSIKVLGLKHQLQDSRAGALPGEE